MPRTGRPKAEVTKDKIVCVRMKAEDYQRLKKYADSSKKTVTNVMLEGVELIINNKTM